MQDERNKLIEDLYIQHYNSVFHLCASIIGYDHQFYPLVEDCVQEAFVKALIHYKEFSNYRNPMGWIALAATNRIKSELRKESNHRKFFSSSTHDLDKNTNVSDECIDHALNQEFVVEQLTKIYQQLTEHEKKIFYAYFIDEKRMKEIIADTGYSMNSVRSAINRIRGRARSIKNLVLFLIIKCNIYH